MRNFPPNLLGTALATLLIVAGFFTAAYFMVRRAQNPNTVPRDGLERRTLPLLKNPTHRQKLLFFVCVLAAGAAPWLTYVLDR